MHVALEVHSQIEMYWNRGNNNYSHQYILYFQSDLLSKCKQFDAFNPKRSFTHISHTPREHILIFAVVITTWPCLHRISTGSVFYHSKLEKKTGAKKANYVISVSKKIQFSIDFNVCAHGITQLNDSIYWIFPRNSFERCNIVQIIVQSGATVFDSHERKQTEKMNVQQNPAATDCADYYLFQYLLVENKSTANWSICDGWFFAHFLLFLRFAHPDVHFAQLKKTFHID